MIKFSYLKFQRGRKRLPPNEIKDLEALGLDPQTVVITEFDLYALILRSKKREEAKKFQKWVYSVIKEIRETGSYNSNSLAIKNELDLIYSAINDFKSEINNQLLTLSEELSVNNIPDRLFALTECVSYFNYKYFDKTNKITIKHLKEYMQKFGILKSNFKPYIKYTKSDIGLELVVVKNNSFFHTIKDSDLFLTKVGLETMIKLLKNGKYI